MLISMLLKGLLVAGIPAGAALVLAVDAHKKESEFGWQMWITVALSGLSLPAFWIVGDQIFSHNLPLWPLGAFSVLFVIGAAGMIYLMRVVPQHWNKLTHRMTKKTELERNKKTDVRDINRHLPNPEKPFDPTSYFKPERGVFVGLSEQRNPIFVERKTWPRMPHAAVMGTSGSGKGVALQILSAQWLESGEALIFVDPKDDEWLPHAMRQSAAKAGKPHYFINLRVKEPQIAIFEGASADEIEECLIAGFGLNDTGTNADFYSLADREYAGVVARAMATRNLTPAEAWQEYREVLQENAQKLNGKLRELAEVEAINAKPGQGVPLQKVIEDGGSIYFVGHMRAERIVRVQKMIPIRVLQLAESRDRLGGDLRPVALVLDEVKYHLSRTLLEGLGAARDKGVHVTVAFQTLADLRDCGALPGDAVEGAIVENCRFKICYQVQDPRLAEWVAQISGTILVDDESRTVQKNVALTETIEGGRMIRQSERYLIDQNMLQNLPKNVSAIFGVGLAQFCHISPLSVKKDGSAIAVNACSDGPSQAPIISHPEDLI